MDSHCGSFPDFFTLIGHAGVGLMIFESGMHFDFEKAKIVGPPAVCVAFLGTVLPLVVGSLLTVMFGRPLMPDGIAAGTALAPTSVGIALRLLGEAGVLQENFGQAGGQVFKQAFRKGCKGKTTEMRYRKMHTQTLQTLVGASLLIRAQ